MGMSRERGFLLAAIVLAVVVRSALWVPRFSEPLEDPDKYLTLARSLADGQGFEILGRPSAYRPPLYPVMLVPVVRTSPRFQVWGIAGLHLILAAGTVGLTWRAARRWGLGPLRAATAAVLVALDPVLAIQSRSVMTETLAAFLLAGALNALATTGWKSGAISGIWLGLAGLCRPSTLACAVLCGLAGLIFGPGTRRQRISRTLAMGTMVILVLAPWAIRNARVFGEPVWTTTHGGYTLALANNPEYYRNVLNGPPGAVWTGPSQRVWAERLYRSLKGLNEPEGDRQIRRQTVEFIREHPQDFLRASAARLARFWGLAPAGAVYSWPIRLATFAWTLPFWAAVAISLRSRPLWTWPAVACLAQVVALSLVHTVFWTDLRMRAPVVPALALMAAHAGLGSGKPETESEIKKNP